MAAGRFATPTVLPWFNPLPPPRMEQASAGVHQVSTIGLQRAQREAQVIAAETLYRQAIGRAADVLGPEVESLRTEAVMLRAEFNKIYPPNIAQRSTAAPAASFGAGAGVSASVSAPVLPSSTRLAPSAPTALVETPE